MINYDLLTHYDTAEAYATFQRAANGDRSNMAEHTSMHLNGIFSVILGRTNLKAADITPEDVVKLAKCIHTEDGCIVDPDSISDPQSVLDEIAFAVSQAMHPNGKVLGITDINDEALFLDVANFYGMDANGEAIDPPPRPNIFKRILNTLFGAFKEDCERYKKWQIVHDRYIENNIDTAKYLENQNQQNTLLQNVGRDLSLRKELDNKYEQVVQINDPDKVDLLSKLYQIGKGRDFSEQEFHDKLSIADIKTFANQNNISELTFDTLQRYQEYLQQKQQQLSKLFTEDFAKSLSVLEADIKQNAKLNRLRNIGDTKGKVDLLLDGSAAFLESAATLQELNNSSDALNKSVDYANAIRPYIALKQYFAKYDTIKKKMDMSETDYDLQEVISLKAVSTKLLDEYSAENATSSDVNFFLELPETAMAQYVGVPKPKIVSGISWHTEDEVLRTNLSEAIRSSKLPSTHIKAMELAEQELNKRFGRESKAPKKEQMNFKALEQQESIVPKAPAKPKEMSVAELNNAIKENITKFNKLDTQASKSFFAHIPGAKSKFFFANINSFYRNVDSDKSNGYKLSRTESAKVLNGLDDTSVRDGLFTLYLLGEGMTIDDIFNTPDELKDKRNALAEQFINDIRIENEENFAKEKGLNADSLGDTYEKYCLSREKEIMDMCRTKLAPQVHKLEEAIGDIDIDDTKMLGDKFRDIALCVKCAGAFYRSVVNTATVNNDHTLMNETRYAEDLNTYSIINDYTEYRNLAFTADKQDAPEYAFYALTARAGAEILMMSKGPDMSDDISKGLAGLKSICAKGLGESEKLERATRNIKFNDIFPDMKKALSDNREAVVFRQFYSTSTFDLNAMKHVFKSSGKSI